MSAKKRTTAPVQRTPLATPPVATDSDVTIPEDADAILDNPDDETDLDVDDGGDTDAPLEDAAPAETTPEPPAPPLPADPPAPTVVVTEESVEIYLRTRHPNVQIIPAAVQQVIDRLHAYADAMGPDMPMTQANGSQHQRALYQTYIIALGLGGGQHRMALDAINWYFNKHRRGAFSPRLICRYTDASRLTKPESSAFGLLSNLFTACCNPATRKTNLAAVNVRLITEKLPNVSAQQNLLDYYIR